MLWNECGNPQCNNLKSIINIVFIRDRGQCQELLRSHTHINVKAFEGNRKIIENYNNKIDGSVGRETQSSDKQPQSHKKKKKRTNGVDLTGEVTATGWAAKANFYLVISFFQIVSSKSIDVRVNKLYRYISTGK